MEQQNSSGRKRPPTFASMYRRSSTSPFCRITGKSHSMDEHHYVPSPDDYPKFDNLCGCRITEKQLHFKDYKYVYPIIDVDGVTRMVTEHDFHCRITAKYKAMAGHKYLYPVLGAKTDKTVEDMISVVEDESMHQVLVPSEVEIIIRGGIQDVLKLKEGEHLFIQSKEGSVFPAAMKEIFKRKEPVAKRPRRHTLPISLEASIANDLAVISPPTIKLLKDIKAEPVKTESNEETGFDMIPEDVEVLKDIRKSRPKRPGRNKNKENNAPKKFKQEIKEEIIPDPIETRVDPIVVKEEIMPNPIEKKLDQIIVKEEIKTETEAPPRLSRLERYKLQFQSFDEQYRNKNSGNQLCLVGAYDKDEVEELDFSEPMEIQIVETHESIGKHAAFTTDVSSTQYSADLSNSSVDNIVDNSRILSNNINNVTECVLNGHTVENSDTNSIINDSTVVEKEKTENDLEENYRPKTFQELKSLIGAELNLEKAIKFQSGIKISSSDHKQNNKMVKENNLNDSESVNLKESSFINQDVSKSNIISELNNELQESKLDALHKIISENKEKITKENECLSEFHNAHIKKTDQEYIMNELKNYNSVQELRNKSEDLYNGNTLLGKQNNQSNQFFNSGSSEKINCLEAIRKEVSIFGQIKNGKTSDKETEHSHELNSHTSSKICEVNSEFILNAIDHQHMNGVDVKDNENYFESAHVPIQNSSDDISSMSENKRENSGQSNKNVTKTNETSPIKRTLNEVNEIEHRELEVISWDSNINKADNNSETTAEVSILGNSNNAYDKNSDHSDSLPIQGNMSIVKSNRTTEKGDSALNISANNREKETKYELQFKQENKISTACLEQDENIKTISATNLNDINVKNISTFLPEISHDLKELGSGQDFNNINVNKNLTEKGLNMETNLLQGEKGKHAYDYQDIPSKQSQVPDDCKAENAKLQNGYSTLESSCPTHTEICLHENGEVSLPRNNFVKVGEVSNETQNSKPDSRSNPVMNSTQTLTQSVKDIGLSGLYDTKPKSVDNSVKDLHLKSVNGVQDTFSLSSTDFKNIKYTETSQNLMQSLESPLLFSSDNDYGSNFNLHSLEVRLPVTCSLLRKEKMLSSVCEHRGICSPPSGIHASMSRLGGNREKQAKWSSACLQGVDVYVAIMDFKPMESDEEAVVMKEGQQVEVIDASKPRRWLVRVLPMTADESVKEGWVPACYLEKSTAYDTLGSYMVTEAELDPKELEALQNREAIVKELVETEEDFAKDMQFVVDNYYKQMENPRLPKEFRDRKGSIFGNFKDISDFHNNVLMEGIHYHAKEPTKLGKTFLRLERDFDMHANYCWNEARAQRLLRDGPLKEYFDDHSRMIDDDKLLADHLKLPIQRLNDYQLLLKELIKYSSRLKEDTTDLQKALDFIHSLNKRTKDLQFIQSIQGYQGDLLKIGKIIRHEVFDVLEDHQVNASERYVFLFKGRLFVTEKRSQGEKENYHVTNLFKLQDVEIVENVDGDPLSILFRSHKRTRPGFPLTLRARSLEQKSNWCRDIAATNQAVEDLGDLEPSIERPIELKDTENLELKHKAEELEEPDHKKPKVESLKRQDSVKTKPSKTSDSVPQTPTEEESKPPALSRQESVKKKSKTDSAPQTPTDTEKPKLSRQESVKKKQKSTESSAPQTPVEESAAPALKRQDSIKKKPKSSESSAPQTPAEETQAPALSRQDSIKKPKKTPITDKTAELQEIVPEESVPQQDSVDKKEKKSSVSEKGEAKPETKVKKQDSQEKKPSEDKPVKRQDSGKDISEKKRGEDLIPKIIMSEDASGSDARLESVDFNEDNATLASESLRSDDSVTPPASEVDPMDKPRFSKTLRGVTCSLGETAVLECETDGSPVPSVTWLKDNQKFAKSARIKTSSQGQKHVLTLTDVTSDDGGLYTVIASSSKGTASCSAPLNLKIPLLGVPKEDSRPTTPGGTVLPHAPVFKVKLNKETQLLEGTSVRFELVVRGNPEPEVKFYKDGKELKLDDRVRVSYESKEVFELILEHVVAKDAGTYSCVATNSEGEDKTVGNLSVVKHKDVFKGLEELEEEREPTPRPKTPKFKWFKDGQFFEANERFQVIFNEEEDSLALMFQHVTPEDAGLYTCVASTSSGSKIACSAELTVQGVIRQVEAPGIKAQLTDVEATEGGSAMLELKITGFPKPKVTWYHKNKEVSTGGRFRFLFADEESFTLVIKNVKKDDSGKYTVKAVNEMGEAESSCNLSVKSAPSFIKGLKDMSVMAEETIKFEAQIDGNPAPEIKWYKDGQQLSSSDRIKISNESGKPCLQILKATPADSGSYSCVLTNSIGSQAEFSNVVVKASPTFSKGMENAEGLEGDTLQFNVEVNGNPKPTVKWTKDGKDLTVDGKHIKVIEEAPNSYTLFVDKATLSDVGVYTCEIRNEHGLKASSGNLNLKTKPEFIKKLSDSECKEGEGITLSTMVKGYPSPSVKWFLGDTALTEDKNYAITSEKDKNSYSLKIKKANRNMSGQYTCKATNEMGEASTSGALTVIVTKKKPTIDQQLMPTQLVEGKPGKIVAKISGEPKPKIQWLKDGKPVSRDGHFTTEELEDGTVALVIDKVIADDAGVYSILAINEDGEARSEAPVTTIPAGKKPEFVKELEKLDLVECQPMKLMAKVTGKPTSIKWQKDGEDISASDTIKIVEEADGTVALMIDNVNQKDAGKYTVIASNAEGKARSTSLVQVQAVKKPEILSALEPLTLNDGETGQLKIKVSGEPKPTITWLKNGKELRPSNRVESIEEPDGTIALVIKNARPEDAGSYSFVAHNPKGEVKSSAPVVVNQAPTFQKPLGPVSVVEGYPAKLEAKLGGSPPPEISWLKDGKPITPDGVHLKEIRSPDGTIALLLDNCNLEDAGRYSLMAKNPLGEDSSSGSLDVSGKEAYGTPKSAPCVVTPLGNLCVKEGEPIRFEAEVAGNPLPDISWTVNDKELEPSDNTLMTFDGKKAILEIKRSSPDHIGVYKCKLTNDLGSASTEGSAAVQEKTAPHFIQRLTDFTGFINQPLKLSCKVTGYPEPEIDWYFNGNLIPLTNPRYNYSHFGDTHTLSIPGAQPEDTGVYECRAKNSLGEDHTRAAVDISEKVEKGEPPMFLKKIGDNEVMEGMTAKFTACVTGIPTPDVSWVKEGEPLQPSPRHKMELESTGILRLIIREVEQSDYGNYSVTISNVHGSATSSAKLCPDSLDDKFITPIGDQFVDFDKFRKSGAPVPLPEKPRIIRMDDSSLTLGWKPSVPNAPRLPVTYQLEMASHPDGEWTPYKIGLKDTLCDVRDLRPGSDYKFRIRVENKHGVSEPSPYTTAHRSKIYEPPTPQDFKPRDYEIEHPPLQKYAAPPRFVRKEEDSMYGVRGQPVTIEFWVYGHPEPQVTWFKGESQIGKDKYTFMQDRNGKLCVFIDCMSDDYVGTYTCVAVNDEGEASMKIKLLIAEPPVFIQKLDETTSMSRRSGRMQCRVTGLPYPKIKWFRDWHPLYESERVKILWEEPDKCTLFISSLITRDNALYSCTATNIAGTVTSSAILNVEDSEEAFDIKSYCRPIPVRPRTKPFEDFYDIGDELGRGTQGVTYHAVKRETGDSYGAKTMFGKGKLKDFMKSEMEIMNQMCFPKLVRLRDAFEVKDTLTLVTDICGGGELLGDILKRGGVSEREVANYIKQILEGLEYMHSRYIGHLGLTIGDVLVARVNSYDIKVGDFGLAARLLPGKDYFLEYGHPEYVAPEIANKQPATVLADMWSVGVITYLLLSGISPFLGEHDRETLTRVQQGKINFVEDAFTGVSDDAKDFMSKLLVFDPKGRMDVKTALNHRWLKYYDDKPVDYGKKLNNLDRLKEYQRRWREWYDNASCKRYYRRRTLESCFHHPSKMIYPPGESYTPPSTPEPDFDRTHIKPSQFDDITFKQRINREEIDFRSESNYQNGPDTYLLQLRDTDFPLRLRQYLRVGASTSPALAANLRDAHWGDSTLVIRERRKFVDVMDEEIDDEKKGLVSTTVPRRIYHEVGTLGFAREQMELLKKEVWKDKGSRDIEIGMAPYFREKIRNMSMKEGEEIVFRCYAIGKPKVDYSWFRNDGILLESSRIVVTQLKDGRCELRINPTRTYDAGVYKCVARNMHGTSCCRARLRLGSKPGRPEPPVLKDASDTEIYITWAVPRDEGQSTTLGYTLEYKKADADEWTLVSHNVEHEYFVVRNLSPSTFYQFRVKAYNKFGWGEPGFATEPYTTKAEGAPKVKVSPRRKYQQEFTERTPEYELKEIELPELDYSRETNPVPIVEGETLDLYRIVSEMDRGRFSVVLNVWVKESNTSSVAKVIQTSEYGDGKQEYEIMKSLCHEKIAMLLSASYKADKTVLVMDKLCGVDVMSYLALRHDYNEELVVAIIKQVLEALQYLHFREICYLELQPDNVVMVNLRDTDIKLIDFGSARHVPKAGAKVSLKGCTEYLAPEIVKNEEVSSLTDVWGVGVLTYILLSGVSPFLGKDEEETLDNVSYVRYHFDNLHPDVTSEVTRFLLNIFKQCPIKRLTVDECLEHKWLSSSEYMIMKRESARFLPDKLASFAKRFHAARYEAMDPEMLTSLGMSSTKQELIIDF